MIVGDDELLIQDLSDTVPYASATGFAAKADWAHDTLFMKVQKNVSTADGWFVTEGEEKEDVPASRFRIGMYAEVSQEEDTEFGFDPEFDIELKTPNLERRLSLYVTTKELGELPGTDPTDRDEGVRIGLRRALPAGFKVDAGVKWDWPLNPFFQLKWRDAWSPGKWNVYPGIKGFWESDDGFGANASFTGDRWFGRGLFRSSSGCRWEENTNGVSWSHTIIIGYARELIDEQKRGSRAGGKDIARGGGLRYRIEGETDTRRIESHEALLMLKVPMRKKWAYFVFAPGVTFRNERDWEAEPSVQLGIDMLFWDVGER